MTRRRLNKFRVPAIDSDASDLLFWAEVLIPLQAEFTLAAGPVDPRNAYPVTNSQLVDGCAFLDDATDNLVAENQRLLHDPRELLPIAIGDMQIGVAHPAGFHGNEYFPGFRLWLVDFLNNEGLFEFVKYSSLHRKEPTITAGRRAGKIPRRSARGHSVYGGR